jgi:hypothetical protein
MFTPKAIQIKSHQNIACWAGVFYILATVAPIMTYPFIGFLMRESGGEFPADFLTQIVTNDALVIIGGLIELIYALAVVGIIATLHPLMKKQRPVLSLSFFSLRFMEAIGVMFHSLILFCLVSLSQAFGGIHAVELQLVVELLLAAREWTFLISSGIIWSLSALILNTLLYQNRLLPRWISVWGLIGAGLSFGAYGLQFFNIHPSEIFYLPIGVQEMVFAGWLIVRGLNIHPKEPNR